MIRVYFYIFTIMLFSCNNEKEIKVNNNIQELLKE